MSKSDVVDKAAIQRRIDRYLKELDEVLKRHGSSWRDRNCILENIQTQIREMLVQRKSENPTVQDIEMVIAELDAPDTYASELSEEAPPSQANPLGPLYFILSYLFLFFFIICAAQATVSVVLNLMGSGSLLIGRTFAIKPIILEVSFAVINLWIATVFRKAAKRK